MAPVPWKGVGLCVLSYTMVHISCQIITCSLPCLLEDTGFKEPWSTSDIGHVIGFASLAAAIGYGVHGPCIDRWGAVFGLSMALGGCCTGAALLATSKTQRQFIAGASVLRFSYAAGWPAEMKALKLMVPEEHQPMAVSTLGFASRGGAILGMCFFGFLTQNHILTWREIAVQAACLLFIVGGGVVITIRQLVKACPSSKSNGQAKSLMSLLQEPAVWLLTFAFACLCQVQHADDFMPLLFRGLTGSSHSVTFSAVYPGGGIAAMALNAWKGHLLTRRQRENLYVIASASTAALLALLLLLYRAEEHEESSQSLLMTWLIALILFVAAFCCAMPYYLVPNLFAFDIMGTECATLIAFFELTSFCSKMPAHMLSLHMAEMFGWDLVLLQMTVTMMFAALLLQALLPRWRSLQTHRRHGGISPMTNSPPLLPGSPKKLVSEIKLEDAHVGHYPKLRKQNWDVSASRRLATWQLSIPLKALNA